MLLVFVEPPRNRKPFNGGGGLTTPLRSNMPVYEYQCSSCEKVTEVLKPISRASEEFELCRFCTGMARRIFSKVGVICRWGTGVVGGERVGYIPGTDNPVKEVKADMKALEEKLQHVDKPKKRQEYKKALASFSEAHEDILR